MPDPARARRRAVRARARGPRPRARDRAPRASRDLVADRVDRIERDHRLLKDEADAAAADLRASRPRRGPARLRPSSSMRPSAMRPGGMTSRTIDSAVTDLPLPDSPTRPSVSPRPIANDTSSTAAASRPSAEGETSCAGARPRRSGVSAELVTVFAEHAPQRVGDFAERGTGLDGRDDGGTRLVPSRPACSSSSIDRCQAVASRLARSARTASACRRFAGRIDAQELRSARAPQLGRRYRLTPTMTCVAAVDGLLRGVRRVLNLPLNPAGLDRRQRAARGVDLSR